MPKVGSTDNKMLLCTNYGTNATKSINNFYRAFCGRKND